MYLSESFDYVPKLKSSFRSVSIVSLRSRIRGGVGIVRWRRLSALPRISVGGGALSRPLLPLSPFVVTIVSLGAVSPTGDFSGKVGAIGWPTTRTAARRVSSCTSKRRWGNPKAIAL